MSDPVPRSEIFYEVSRRGITRLLSQLDRQPFSTSFGSWHRNYWHHRLSDFSSSACQQGILSLALLWKIEREDNPFHRNPSILSWIEASASHLLSLQHRDGSFDEWYPNERGWAGPTGYVMYALLKTCELMEGRLAPATLERVRKATLKSCAFLRKFEETDVLANHQAMALLAVSQARRFLRQEGSEELDATFEELLARLRQTTCEEGWSLEYDGADPGYQTATLSFLGRAHAATGDARIAALIPSMLEFVSCFFFGRRGFGGTQGSRSTRNLFHFGFEYWARSFPLAETLAARSRRMLADGTLLSPSDQEDHYLIYRVPEMLEAYLAARPAVVEQGPLPCEIPGFRRVFPVAGIVCQQVGDAYAAINLKKGGALQVLGPGDRITEDSGWMLETRRRRLVTSSHLRRDGKIEIGDMIFRVAARGSRISQPLFTVWTFLGFRLLLKAAAFSPRSAQWLKRWIRSRIVTGKKSARGIGFNRTIELTGQGIQVTDEIWTARRAGVVRAWVGGGFVTRAVPQSRYFIAHELDNSPEEVDFVGMKSLRETGRLRVSRWVR